MKQTGSPMKVLSGILMVGQLGISLVVPILLFTFLGVYLTEKWQTGPWLTIVAVLCGVITAGCTFYRLARGFLSSQAGEDRSASREQPQQQEQTAEKGEETHEDR